jgi:hypothetical protein
MNYLLTQLGCEIWSPIIREDYRLRKVQNKVLKRMSVPKKEETTGE